MGCSPGNPKSHVNKRVRAWEKDAPARWWSMWLLPSGLAAPTSRATPRCSLLVFVGLRGQVVSVPPCSTCTSPGFPVSPYPKSSYHHLKFSLPVASMSCTGTKSFSDLFNILSVFLTHHLKFLLHAWVKAHAQIVPSFPFAFFSPFTFWTFLQFPSCPAPNPALPSTWGG